MKGSTTKEKETTGWQKREEARLTRWLGTRGNDEFICRNETIHILQLIE